MKQLMILTGMALLTACGGAGENRPEDIPDNPSGSQTTVRTTDTNPMDTSTHGVQDSTTTIGYDTSARQKN
jgi:hypothetical protein